MLLNTTRELQNLFAQISKKTDEEQDYLEYILVIRFKRYLILSHVFMIKFLDSEQLSCMVIYFKYTITVATNYSVTNLSILVQVCIRGVELSNQSTLCRILKDNESSHFAF